MLTEHFAPGLNLNRKLPSTTLVTVAALLLIPSASTPLLSQTEASQPPASQPSAIELCLAKIMICRAISQIEV